MRRNWLLMALVCLVVLVYGQANATSISAKVSPEIGTDTVLIGEPFTVDLYFENDYGELGAVSIPTYFYSPDGSIENVTHYKADHDVVKVIYDWRLGDTLRDSSISMTSDWNSLWLLINQWFGFSWDGILPDTSNFTGAAVFGWMPTTQPMNYVDFTLLIDEQGTFCIDSCDVYPPFMEWLFDDPTATFNGPYCFTVHDPFANNPPVFEPIGNKEVTEGELLEFTVTATDADGDAISIGTSIKPSGATFVDHGDGTGTFSWTPSLSQGGTYYLTFYASDTKDVASELIMITVHEANMPPELTVPGPQSVDENSLLEFSVSAVDPDGTTPDLTTSALPDGAVFTDNDNGTGDFSWTPIFDQAGVYPISFYASDGAAIDTAVVEITVNEVNRPPELTVPGVQSVDENTLLEFSISAVDPDGTTPDLTTSALPDGAVFTDNDDGTGDFSWTPTYDQAGVYPISFYASDGAAIDTAVVEITVNDVGQPPTITVPGLQTVNEDELLTFGISATDPDGTFPDLTASALPDGAVFTDNDDGTGSFEWTPTFEQAGGYSVRFYASDGVNIDSADVAIDVINVNRAPVLDQVASGPQFVDEGASLVLDVTSYDPDGTFPDLLVENIMINANFTDNDDGTGQFVFNPDTTQAGDYVLTFIATDGELADSEVVAIVVNDVQPDVQLVVDATPRSYTLIEGDNSVPDSVYATELFDRTIDFSLNSNVAWIGTFDESYSTPGYGMYTISSFGLSQGTYSDTLFVLSNDAVNTPIGIPIDLTVIAAVDTQLVASPASFEYTLDEGGSLTDEVTITENNQLIIQFELTNKSSWLTLPVFITPPSTPTTIPFDVNSDRLAPGVYYDTLTAVPVSGDVEAGVLIPVMLTVEEIVEPQLVVQPDLFEFSLEYGSSVTAIDSVSVSELGGQSINFWTGNMESWLYLDTIPVSPLFTPKKFAIDINTAGLNPGMYIDTIWIWGEGAINSPQYIPVTLTITADYVVQTSVQNLHYTLEPGQIIYDTVHVYEMFDRTVEFDTWNTEIWLDVEPDMAGPYLTPKTLDIIITDSGMTMGNTYYDTIRIISTEDPPLFEKTTVLVTVDYIEPAPEVVVSPDSFTFTLSQGEGLTGLAMTVYETHGFNIPFSYELMLGSSWLEFDPPTITVIPETPDSVMFNINTDGLAVGAYSDTILVYDPTDSPGVVFETIKVPVVLFVVEEQAVLEAIPDYFDVTLTIPDSLWLVSYIYSPQFDTIPYWPISVGGSDWLVIPNEGEMRYTPDSLQFMVHSFGLAEGVYVDSIAIYNDIPNGEYPEPVLMIPVVLHVQAEQPPAVVMTWPTMFEWTVPQGGSVYDSLFVYDTTGQSVLINFMNSQPWLAVEPLGMPPYMTPVSLIVTANSMSLMPGTYYDTIVVSSPLEMPPFDPVYVPVMLTVEGAAEAADSVWMPAPIPAIPGNMVTMPIYFRNFDPLSAIHLPLTWNSGSVVLESITFDGTRVEYVDTKPTAIDNDTWHAEIAILPTFVDDVPAGRGMMAKLNFRVLQGATEAEVIVDTSSFFTGYGLTFINSALDIIYPSFTAGRILIDTSSAMVCGRVVDDEGHEIEGATVELWDDFPGGGVLMTEMTDINGQFLCHANSVFPFDAYAYKDGYYPGLVEDIEFNEIGFDIVLTKVPDVAETWEWVNFYCGENYFYNVPLPIGSVVDAYDPDGIHCGTWFVKEAGKYGFMPVYRDEPFTIEDEGAEPGEEISFFINGYPANAVGDRTWTEFGDTSEVCLDVFTIEERTMALDSGWNLISWNVDTPMDDIAMLLADVTDCIEVVLGFEEGGLTYDPNLPEFSTLLGADHYHGYWVKMSCPATLVVTGVPVAATTPIDLEAGWNLVSYLPNVSDTTPHALESIYDNLFIALGFDGDGLIWDPNVAPEYSSLQHMYPGHGYWVKVMSDDMLIYPGVGPSVVFQQRFVTTAKEIPSEIASSRQWINVYSHELILDGETVPAGAEVELVASDGRIVGAGYVDAGGCFGFVPVYGDDPTTTELEGLHANEEFGLVIDGVATEETFTWTSMGDKVEIGAVTAKTEDNVIPTEFSLGQNYPNPFNPVTNISFSVPQSMTATIEVYNILGKKVRTVFDGMAEAGRNTVIWDGTNANGEPVASGIYFYRMQAGSYEMSRKMVLMK